MHILFEGSLNRQDYANSHIIEVKLCSIETVSQIAYSSVYPTWHFSKLFTICARFVSLLKTSLVYERSLIFTYLDLFWFRIGIHRTRGFSIFLALVFQTHKVAYIMFSVQVYTNVAMYCLQKYRYFDTK